MIKTELSFDLGLYGNSLGGLHQDLVALTLEHQDTSEAERITPYKLAFDDKGEPVGFKPRWLTEKDFLENQGMYSMRDLAKNGAKYILWISPQSEKFKYSESRAVVGIVNGTEIECRALCLRENADYCLRVVNDLGYKFDNPDELRAKAMAFEVEGDDWIKYLENKINKPEIWQRIREGKDIEAKENRGEDLKSIVDNFAPRIEGASRQQLINIGAEMERAVMALGIRLSAKGDCGVLNSTLLAKGRGSFDQIFLNSPRMESYFNCPRCEGKIPSGKGIEKCPHCGMTKQEAGSVCD